MSSKHKFSSNGIKNRLKSASDDQSDTLFSNDFNMSNVQGDTGIHYVSISSLSQAPAEWNFYSPLNDQKMTELIDSILSKGLLHPIVVWQKEENAYMILAGHNRVRAYQYIYGATQDEKYLKIPALIKPIDAITEDEAKEIIIDTNWVQRNLTALEKSRSIVEKYAVLQSKSNYKSNYGAYGEGRIREVIAEQYHISGRQVDELKRLTNLHESLKEKLINEEISYTVAAKAALFDEETQLWMLQNHSKCLTSKYTRRFNATMNREDLEKLFNQPLGSLKNISFKVSEGAATLFDTLPSTKRQELSRQIEQWIKEVSSI